MEICVGVDALLIAGAAVFLLAVVVSACVAVWLTTAEYRARSR